MLKTSCNLTHRPINAPFYAILKHTINYRTFISVKCTTASYEDEVSLQCDTHYIIFVKRILVSNTELSCRNFNHSDVEQTTCTRLTCDQTLITNLDERHTAESNWRPKSSETSCDNADYILVAYECYKSG